MNLERTIVSASDAPPAVGPYSQGIATPHFVFLAGQIPLVGQTGQLIEGGITEQTEQVIANIRALLESQGLTLSNVVKSTVFLADMNEFAAMNAVYAKHFTDAPPARSTVQVARLPKDSRVEIEVLALKPSKPTIELPEHTADHATLAREVYKAAHVSGNFTLRSGATSTEYFDKYLFEAQPQLLKKVAAGMVPLLFPGADAVASLEMGGIPIGTVISQLTGLPLRFVRKLAKSYGTCKIAEGGSIAGQKLVIIEDVITSGGAVIDAAESLRSEGAEILGVVCVIDRQSGGKENLAAKDLPLRSLFTMGDLKDAAGV